MQSFYRCLGAAAALAGLAAAMAPTRARALEPPAVIVVVDASGSMWGMIDGSRLNKLFLLRESLRLSLGKIGRQTRVGLAAFGHRRPGACADVEVIHAPQPLDLARIMAPLEQMSPRGVGPLTLALREAAKALPADSGRRSLLLLHDDADNCQPDLCAAAAELSTAGIAVYAVGLGTKPEDMAKMACLTQTTGGRHFNPQNAEQAALFIDEALRLASGDTGPGLTASTALAPAAVVAPVPVPASGPPALHLRARLAANSEPLSLPLRWIVAAEAHPEVALFDAVAANPVVPVAPGRYIVEVSDGIVSARETVTVRDNRPAAVSVVLGAGAVRVRVTAQKTAAPLNDAVVTISHAGGASDKRDPAGAGLPISVVKASETLALLPAGRFVVRAELGLVYAEETVTVVVGRPVSVDMRLNVARLQLTTVGRDGAAPLELPIFSIARDDPDAAAGGKREVARSAAKQAEFVLPPDTYYIIARQGSVESSTQLAIGPGEVRKHALTASAGRLSLSTKAVGIDPRPSSLVSYLIERIDDPSQESVATSLAAPVLFLPSGRYRVEGRYGAMNVRSVQEIEIKAGQAQQLVFEHQAARLRLRLDGAVTGTADTFWEVRDEGGRTVWMSAQTEAIGALQPGRYSVTVDTREKRYRPRRVELGAGEAKLVEISAD